MTLAKGTLGLGIYTGVDLELLMQAGHFRHKTNVRALPTANAAYRFLVCSKRRLPAPASHGCRFAASYF